MVEIEQSVTTNASLKTRFYVGCAGAAAAIALAGLFMGEPRRAAQIAVFAIIDGALGGAALALVTRTRRPLGIYLWLAVAALSFWPLFAAGNAFSIWGEWFGSVGEGARRAYLDFMRASLYFCVMPIAFTALGQHGPDPPPAS